MFIRGNSQHFCDDPVCPDTVRKPLTEDPLRRYTKGDTFARFGKVWDDEDVVTAQQRVCLAKGSALERQNASL